MFDNILFLYPYFFIIVPFYIVCIVFCNPRTQVVYFSNMPLLTSLSKSYSTIIKILRFLIVLFVTISLATPVKKDEVILNNQKGYDIALLFDASSSMKEDDRFDTTKKIINDFIQSRDDSRFALSVFADFGYIVSPLTDDKKSLQDILKYIKVGVAGRMGTALYESLYLSVDLFKQSSAKNKIIILLTDGIDNTNTIPLDIAIAKLKKYGIKVYTIAIGNEKGYNKKVLEKLSLDTNGVFFEVDDIKGLKNIYDKINSLEKSDIKSKVITKYDYLYQYSLDIALGFLFILLLLQRRGL